jgi:hypothetical protein
LIEAAGREIIAVKRTSLQIRWGLKTGMSDRPSWRRILNAVGLPMRAGSSAARREIEQSGLFDAAWYRSRVPEAVASTLDPLDHYIEFGASAGHSPGPHFDAAWYLERYNDVAAGQLNPLLHFIRYGKQEGRDPYPPAPSLFDHFQSLGSNCELGEVQRHFGSEPLGLFRFATTPLKGLMPFLTGKSDPFASPATVEIVVGDGGEYNVVVKPYGFIFHTDVASAAMQPDRARDHQLKKLRFLWRKLVEDLEEGDRIFVYKSGLWMAKSRIAELAALLRRRGPNHLLWVTEAEPGWPAGTVKLVAPGLMRGAIDRLSTKEGGISFEMWRQVCRRAHRLWSQRTK